ncbi:recombinase family protein [Falsiroseomonas sp.]|uniref:recombinase family protein n=1 Tax=Falsiroseomonas sp. TaxID=2870721 RepID=UPI0027324212|nr:recombinase family protein [Falsiroseomonas sp.]MDP3416118.1 recombinase family protein [Falsiroseomonas sp.]
MLLGYARVSTDGQDHALQLDALNRAGCERVFIETAPGARADRPELARLLEQARAGDTIVCWRLDRLGRSLKHLLDLSEQLQVRGIGLKSLTEAIDTTTPAGRLMFSVLGALSAMEREVLQERTRAGLAAAAARGRRGGRPPSMDDAKVRAARAMLASGTMTAGEVAMQIGVSPSTLYRHVPGGRAAAAEAA